MSGTANIAQMESFFVSKIDFSYADEPGITYVQEFNPFVTYAMLSRDIDPVPDDEDVIVIREGGGCDAGFGLGLGSGFGFGAACVFALLAAGRKRRA